MSKAAIVLDTFKLPVFEQVLTEAGYKYTCEADKTMGFTIIRVETNATKKLLKVIERANALSAEETLQ